MKFLLRISVKRDLRIFLTTSWKKTSSCLLCDMKRQNTILLILIFMWKGKMFTFLNSCWPMWLRKYWVSIWILSLFPKQMTCLTWMQRLRNTIGYSMITGNNEANRGMKPSLSIKKIIFIVFFNLGE